MPPQQPSRPGKNAAPAARIAALRARLGAMEGLARGPVEAAQAARILPATAVPGLAALAAALPGGGLPRAALHEVSGPQQAINTGFSALLLAALGAAQNAPLMWVASDKTLYGPGLAAFGLDPARLILVQPRRENDVLWAMEEGLRAPALAAVLGETGAITLFASRRLQLAAEASGVTALLLRREGTSGRPPSPSAAVTRWRVSPLPGPAACPTVPRWRVALWRCRGGRPGDWIVTPHNPKKTCPEDIHHGAKTDCIALPAPLRH